MFEAECRAIAQDDRASRSGDCGPGGPPVHDQRAQARIAGNLPHGLDAPFVSARDGGPCQAKKIGGRANRRANPRLLVCGERSLQSRHAPRLEAMNAMSARWLASGDGGPRTCRIARRGRVVQLQSGPRVSQSAGERWNLATPRDLIENARIDTIDGDHPYSQATRHNGKRNTSSCILFTRRRNHEQRRRSGEGDCGGGDRGQPGASRRVGSGCRR